MEKDEHTKFNLHIFYRVLIILFCIFIGTCVSIVMVNIYNPSQNALRALSSVSMDVACIIIMLIMVASFAFEHYGTNRTTKLFAIMLVASIWALFLDFLNWAFDGSLEFGHLTYWFTVGSLCMGAVLAGIFCVYLYSYMAETHGLGKMRIRAYISAALNLASFVLSFVLAMTGTAFRFVDGHYEIGALYDFVTAIPVLSVLYISACVIRNAKKIGLHDVFAVVGYILFMVAGALIEAKYSIGTTYVAVSIADIFIFVMLQNGIIAKEKRNVQKWMKKSKTDELTGLNNRYAYEADLEQLERNGIDDDFVFVSVDVNLLKSINDSYGHNAGDELLIGAAECMENCFGPYGKIYRMGGDEFIALINTDSKSLKYMQKRIEELTEAWKGELVENLSISCGYVAKSEAGEMTIREIAVLADQRMYEAKNDFYKRKGINRRKI